MAKKYQTFPGMDDVLPEMCASWRWLENRAVSFFTARGYQEIRTPTLEPTELFVRSIGEASDIVHKEMYTFEDRGNRSMTMRPEMTASVARSVIQHSLMRNQNGLALFYLGAMYRAEKPQAGRKRQFHQIGAELIASPFGEGLEDVRIIHDLYRFLADSLQLKNLTVRLNDLSLLNGPEAEAIKKNLRDYFSASRAALCEDCHYRLEKNVLRIFDCKNKNCQKIIEATDWESIAPLSEAFGSVYEALKEKKIPLEVNRRLVRGLDYYTGVVFEIASSGLGAQDALAGGGRYDRLYEELGAKPTPCTGFSIGFERLVMALAENKPNLSDQVQVNTVYVAPLDLDQAQISEVQSFSEKLSSLGFVVEAGDAKLNLNAHLKRANKLGAAYMLIRGGEEAGENMWKLKLMQQRKEESLKAQQVILKLLEGTQVL